MAAYKDAISNTSMDLAPWYIIPANRKWSRDLAISEIMTETLASLAIPLPDPPADIEVLRKPYRTQKTVAPKSGRCSARKPQNGEFFHNITE